jgi:hypothetical protein
MKVLFVLTDEEVDAVEPSCSYQLHLGQNTAFQNYHKQEG